MPRPHPFRPDQFTATAFDTAEDKAKAANALASFVDAGMPYSKFSNAGVYHTLYQHMFSHIAHYDRDGFYDEWFSTPEARSRWIDYALNFGPWGYSIGDPGYTWADVEVAFVTWLNDSGIPHRVHREAEATVERRELGVLAALKEKYGE